MDRQTDGRTDKAGWRLRMTNIGVSLSWKRASSLNEGFFYEGMVFMNESLVACYATLHPALPVRLPTRPRLG